MLLTINALEVKEVGSVVHLIELQAHFHQVACHWILPSNSQMVWVHHLTHTHTHKRVNKYINKYFKNSQNRDSVCVGFFAVMCFMYV